MTEQAAGPARVPRLVSDVFRGWVSLAFMLPTPIVLAFVAIFVVRRWDLDVSLRTVQATILLATLAIYFVGYEVLTWRAFRRTPSGELRRRISLTTPRRPREKLKWWLSGGSATSWSSTAALFSLAAVAYIAFDPELRTQPAVLVASGLVVMAGWFMLPITYAVQYLRKDVDDPGLEFPGDEAAEFSDYLYLAIQVTTTYSTSDVVVTSRGLRTKVSVHSMIAFVYNSVIIALLVSALLIAASN